MAASNNLANSLSLKDKGKDGEASPLPPKRFGPRPALTGRQKRELNKAFGEFDPRGVGLINSRSFIVSLRAMGFEPKIPSVKNYIEEVIGPRGRDVLDFKDYYELMSQRMIGDDSRPEMAKTFKMFCDTDKGVITLENLADIAEDLGEDISPDELREMISFANTSKSGEGVTLDEFIKMMERPELE